MDAPTAATVISALATAVIAITGIAYTIYTNRLWKETRRQAENSIRQAATAQRQVEIAQQMLDAAHRPWLGITLFADVGTGPHVVNVTSVLHNYGTVPATVTAARMRVTLGEDIVADGTQLQSTQVPSQMCVYPGDDGALQWGAGETSMVPWPNTGWLRFGIEVEYLGAFTETPYRTQLLANYPVPDGRLTQRSTTPMDVVRADTK